MTSAMKLRSLILLLLVIVGPSLRATAQPPPTDIPDDLVVTLERTGCKGLCPAYRLTLAADGTVMYEGFRHVKTPGKAREVVSKEQLRQLVREVEQVFASKDFGHSDHDENDCDELIADAASANTTVRMNGRKKAFYHYLACVKGNGFSPLDLDRFEKRIDELVGSEKWIRSQSIAPTENPQWLDEIIVHGVSPPWAQDEPQAVWRYEYKGQVVYYFMA
jgi:hypothetical protein